MVGTIEDALDMKRRPQRDELSDWDRKNIGTFVRLEIPLTDIYKLRKVANLLRGVHATPPFLLASGSWR